jgi:hypothetical protein
MSQVFHPELIANSEESGRKWVTDICSQAYQESAAVGSSICRARLGAPIGDTTEMKSDA